MLKLSFCDLLGDGKRHEVKASITTDSLMSRFGYPVLFLEDGKPLDGNSWILLNYQIVSISNQDEAELLKKWIDQTLLHAGINAAAEFGRRGGSVSSEAKTKAARENAKKPRKPR